jgi:hypothetical protein
MLDVLAIYAGIAISGVIGFLVTKRYVNRALGDIADVIVSIFEKPLVKGSMSVLAKKSNEVQADKRAVDEVFGNIIDSPQFTAIKILGDQLGFSIDDMVEKYGALGTLQALRQGAGALGIDINELLLGGALGGAPAEGKPSGDNPYFRR